MADRDDDAVVIAASFLYFNEDNANEEDRVRVKHPRRFWIHDTLHRRQVSHKFVNIKLTMDVVGHVFLCVLEDRRNQDLFSRPWWFRRLGLVCDS